MMYDREIRVTGTNLMTRTALSRLQDQIDAVRRESFAEGYAAAMRSVRDFAARPPAPVSGSRPATPANERAAIPGQRPGPRRLRRGTNARLIESVLQSIAPRAIRPTEIRNALRRDQGIALAFTSIRHALGQLEARHTAEQVAHSKTWRYLPELSGVDAGTG
jgi:hypothetical protein